MWKSENSNCQSCILFCPSEQFPNGVLPTRKAIIESILYLKDNASGDGQNQASICWLVSKDVALHWIFCNVYPKSPQSVRFIVETLWEEFQYLRNYVHSKKKETYWKKYKEFLSTINSVPDFIEPNSSRVRLQEKLWNCDMNKRDKDFHQKQLQSPPSGYCFTFVDKKWKKTQERKESRLKRTRLEFYEFYRETPQEPDNIEDDGHCDFHSNTEKGIKTPDRKKYEYSETPCGSASDRIPYKYRHIRDGLRSVRS